MTFRYAHSANYSFYHQMSSKLTKHNRIKKIGHQIHRKHYITPNNLSLDLADWWNRNNHKRDTSSRGVTTFFAKSVVHSNRYAHGLCYAASCGVLVHVPRQTSNISRTKSQNLNASRLVSQLSLSHLLKPGCNSRTGDAPTTSERLTILLPTTVRLVYEVWGYLAILTIFFRVLALVTEVPGPCITTAIWRCRNPFSQWQRSLQWKLRSHWLKLLFKTTMPYTVIILGMDSANERWRYTVTSSLNGRARTQNDSWHTGVYCVLYQCCSYQEVADQRYPCLTQRTARQSRPRRSQYAENGTLF